MSEMTAFVVAMVWSLSALAQTNTTPDQTDGTAGGILFGLFALVAAVVVGGIVFVFLKRRKNARR